jgi:hypothetical protein
VSHAPQRIEKDCLNCGTMVQGHYCQNCGQENIVPKETFWHMFTHFFYDITHFDGSFFTTLKDLLFKPGFLTREYMKGRRKSYLHPVRMYVFTSAVFFLVFFSLYHVSESDIDINSPENIDVPIQKKDPAVSDSISLLPGFKTTEDSLANIKIDTTLKNKSKNGDFNINFGNADKYKSVHEYDSIQRSLPKSKRDNWVKKMINKKAITINLRYKDKENTLQVDLLNKFIHSIPYILFASLPLFALFLKLLYIRRKQFYYADHGVFLIHLYIFTFLFMLFWFSLDKLKSTTNWGGFGIIQTILVLIGLFYTLKSLKNFYQQGWGKTILKFILFNLFCLVAAVFLFSFFLLFSLFQI